MMTGGYNRRFNVTADPCVRAVVAAEASVTVESELFVIKTPG
jgi:hypothetical protein